VTQVAGKLRASGAIRSNRRGLIEIDRPRLETAACECYQLMRRRIDRIILTEETKPHGYAAPLHENLRAQTPLLAKAEEVQRHTRTHGVTGPRPRNH
jgi:hypothetical protein